MLGGANPVNPSQKHARHLNQSSLLHGNQPKQKKTLVIKHGNWKCLRTCHRKWMVQWKVGWEKQWEKNGHWNGFSIKPVAPPWGANHCEPAWAERQKSLYTKGITCTGAIMCTSVIICHLSIQLDLSGACWKSVGFCRGFSSEQCNANPVEPANASQMLVKWGILWYRNMRLEWLDYPQIRPQDIYLEISRGHACDIMWP